jgi:hypothetical protein
MIDVELKERVRQYVLSRGTYGATSDEVEIALAVSCTAEFRELKHDKRIVETGIWRKSRIPDRSIMPVCIGVSRS